MEERKDECKLLASSDIYKEDDKVVLRMEMPGVNKESLNIQIDGNMLIIEGRRDTTVLQGEYRIKEIRQGDYYHEFTLDDTIDRSKVDARIEFGILTVILKMKESEKPRMIKVSSD